MPEQLDIANLDHWLGFRPGMTRSEVEEKVRQAGEDPDPNDDDSFSAEIEGLYLQFWFEPGGEKRLRQLSTDGEILWNGKAVMNLPLDDALRAFEPFAQSPIWEASDAADEPFSTPRATSSRPITDETLQEEGTVWLPSHGLGLVLWRGEVVDLVWRLARDLPAQYVGPVTEAQRQLSKRPDLDAYLRSKSAAATNAGTPKTPLSILQTILVWICVALLAFIARLGFKEMQRWNSAPTLEGQFVSKESLPRKKYLDLAPDVVRNHMPDDPKRTREMYLVEYFDPTGRPQKATLEAGEFYVAPREPGEKVQIAYLAGDPPRVKGLSRARDAAFIEYMPWAIAVGFFYLIAQLILGFLPRLFKAVVKFIAPRSDTVVIDRPELR